MRVLISCGEPSGDLYAGALAAEIRRQQPSASIAGFGGDRLAASGATLIERFGGLSVTGLVEVVRLLPKTYGIYRRLLEDADRTRPDVFVAIDFPDFNFVLARAMKKRGVPVVYYISPQLWAWRPGRMKTMKRIADRVLVIFPFEERIYREAGVPVEWVGHPLLDVTPPAQPRDDFLRGIGLDPSRPVLALLPGSRANEIRQILPVLLRVGGPLRDAMPEIQFVLARAPHLDDLLFFDAMGIESDARGFRIIQGRTDDVLAAADAAVVASGTATVQAALHECPMVVVYRLSPLTYRVGKPFVQVDTYAMANLVAGRKVVPELIQDAFTPETTAAEVLRIFRDRAYADAMRTALHDVKARLGDSGASERAARIVLDVARSGGRVQYTG